MSGRAVALLGIAAFAASGAAATTVERQALLMGTRAEIRVAAADRAVAVAGGETVLRALETAERRLSTWTDGSELAALNAAPVGKEVAVSPLLARELAASLACARRTDGAFDPTVGALVAAWQLRAGGARPQPEVLAEALARTGAAGLVISPERGTAVRRRPVVVEEGGFGKGAALDAALAAARTEGGWESLTVDLGGQLLVAGSRAVAVVVADPGERSRPVLEIEVTDGSLATSGNGERGLIVDGERVGHLLDPRTGRPAPDFGSVTVRAPTGLEADCLATALFVMGPEAALAWAAEHSSVDVLVLTRGPEGLVARATPGIAERARPLVPEIEIVKEEGPRRRPAAGG